MTDKEFKRLSRLELIEIIYQYQLQVEKLTEEKQALEEELMDKRLRLSNVGNIAEAALEMNDCFISAQNAAEQYLNEVKEIIEDAKKERQRILEDAKKERQKILADAIKEATAIVASAKKKQEKYDSAIVDKQNPSDNG